MPLKNRQWLSSRHLQLANYTNGTNGYKLYSQATYDLP